MIDLGVVGCQIELKPGERGQQAEVKPKSLGNPTDLFSHVKRESRKILSQGLSGHEIFLEANLRRRGPLRNKGQLEVINDAIHHGTVGEEGDDLMSGWPR